VIKGVQVLLGGRRWTFNGVGPKPRVLVGGIGDQAICNSEARKYDTRIFLVSKSDAGQLRLNSSLVRISLSNIERTEAIVNGKFRQATGLAHCTVSCADQRLMIISLTLIG